jgi:hypothetical protein
MFSSHLYQLNSIHLSFTAWSNVYFEFEAYFFWAFSADKISSKLLGYCIKCCQACMVWGELAKLTVAKTTEQGKSIVIACLEFLASSFHLNLCTSQLGKCRQLMYGVSLLQLYRNRDDKTAGGIHLQHGRESVSHPPPEPEFLNF